MDLIYLVPILRRHLFQMIFGKFLSVGDAYNSTFLFQFYFMSIELAILVLYLKVCFLCILLFHKLYALYLILLY